MVLVCYGIPSVAIPALGVGSAGVPTSGDVDLGVLSAGPSFVGSDFGREMEMVWVGICGNLSFSVDCSS